MSTRIAIIEDDPVIAQMYRMKFEAEGFEVQTAENGAVGVELVKDMQPDVALVDIRMPVMDGPTAIKKIREMKGKNPIIIVLTNVGEEEAPTELGRLNIHSYIVKAESTPKEV
ncbi:MAG TPA: response regulator, partial [Candidatus Saccharimonadales bacterium]|nr:response regulator [Candidatus Saccharimonadales bacterium]